MAKPPSSKSRRSSERTHRSGSSSKSRRKRQSSKSKVTWGRTLKRWFRKARTPLALAAGAGLVGYAAYHTPNAYWPNAAIPYVETFRGAVGQPNQQTNNGQQLAVSGMQSNVLEHLYSDLPAQSMLLGKLIDLSSAVWAQSAALENFLEDYIGSEDASEFFGQHDANGVGDTFIKEMHDAKNHLRKATKQTKHTEQGLSNFVDWSLELLDTISKRPWLRNDCSQARVFFENTLRFIVEQTSSIQETLQLAVTALAQCVESAQRAISLCTTNSPKLVIHRAPLTNFYHNIVGLKNDLMGLMQYTNQMQHHYRAVFDSGVVANLCNYAQNVNVRLDGYPERIKVLEQLKAKLETQREVDKRATDEHFRETVYV